MRARVGDGFDLDGQSSHGQWAQRLGVIFSLFGEAKPQYGQLRYLDEFGNELVRVEIRDSGARLIPALELQNKADSGYFEEAMAMGQGDVYASPLELNKEHGRIERPITPVVRFSTPVYDQPGTATVSSP